MSRPATAGAPNGAGDPLAELRGRIATLRASFAEPLGRLGDRFELTAFERDLLLLCAAPELDEDPDGFISHLAAVAHPARPSPTFALARRLFGTWEPGAAAPQGPLRHWHLIEISQPGVEPLMASALGVDARLLGHLQGLDDDPSRDPTDQRIAPFLERLAPADEDDLSTTQGQLCGDLAGRIRAHGPGRCVAQLVSEAATAQLHARRIVALVGGQTRLYRAQLAGLHAQPAELEIFARLWLRECRLRRLALLLELDDIAAGEPEERAAARLIERYSQIERLGAADRPPDLILLITRDARPALPADLLCEPRKPGPAEQRAAWRRQLAARGLAGQPALLAAQFSLNLPEIRRNAGLAMAGADPKAELWRQSCAQARPRLSSLAERLAPADGLGLDDVKLPERERRQLAAICGQVAQRSTVYDRWGFRARLGRGLGIGALFAGPSGTGKTMAAEALAAALRLDLYRIDLAGVVNKYIGETEKNLRRLFDAAEDSGAILFFDEADALFGKRSEVKDSHDRYANIEINYLLQRMEQYCGLAILATNRKSALDAAFTRRLRFIVDFPFPEAAEREQIWRRLLPAPPAAPLRQEPLDYRFLAGLSLSGGSIRNAALNAAFAAAARGEPLSMPLLLEAARDEQLKHGLRETLALPPAVRRRRERLRGRGLGPAAAERLAWHPADDAALDRALDGLGGGPIAGARVTRLIAALEASR